MKRALVVDDNRDNLYYLTALLTGNGFTVDTALHGAEALAAARRALPDILISDLLMPVMDGYTLLRHWKGDPRLKKVPFIVYTATYTSAEDERLALNLGADAFIVKPAEPEEFMARIREIESRALSAASSATRDPVGDEGALIQQYSEALVRKLEQKIAQQAATHHALEQEVTGRLALEKQLAQSQKLEAVGQLTGGVAHDFNNLLAVISGNLELLEEALQDRPELSEMLQSSIRATDRGAVLTRSLLAFSRQQPLDPRPVDANMLVREMTTMLQRTLPATIAIEFTPGATWLCDADPGQLQNAVLNLVLNARDAMPEGGRLTLETGNAELDDDYSAAHAEVAPGEYVMLAVSDTGMGMRPETVARAFEPFFSTKEVGKGTGLGLSMVYGFTKQSLGHVKIYSEAGQGTTVRIYLPRSAADVPTRSSVDSAEAAAARGQGETILVVEDDRDVRALAERLLRSLGYEVVAAGEGKTALGLLRDNPRIVLLLTDVVLPGGLNGRRLADEATRLRPDIKVVYMSGYTENAILHHGRLDPGVELLEKPFSKRKLASKIRTVLARGSST